jgi:hypothetical protein
MTIRPIFAWYDLWVGIYVDRPRRRIYILPLPCVGAVVEWGSYEPALASHVSMERRRGHFQQLSPERAECPQAIRSVQSDPEPNR